jgi:hypothetical protein
VLVPVLVVGGMAVRVVDVVGVIAVGHCFMPTPIPVGVIVFLVGDMRGVDALVPMPVVGGVDVSVMEIVRVVTVGDRDMATALPMGVGVIVVGGMCVGRHEISFSGRSS